MTKTKTIFLAKPRGFCAGVRRALDTVDHVLESFGEPVYVLHEIVHNEYVVEGYRRQGVVFVENLDEVPAGSPLVFSAHGVAKSIEALARKKSIKTIDATCPLVKRIHEKVIQYRKQDYNVILIGHKMHPEVIGTVGQVEDGVVVVESIDDVKLLDFSKGQKLAYLTQTTLCEEQTQDIIVELKTSFPHIIGDSGICYATKNRQSAIRRVAELSDTVFVIGSKKSSNSQRLLEIAKSMVSHSYLICSEKDVDEQMISGEGNIGITAAASAPEILVENVCALLDKKGWSRVVEIGDSVENTNFPLVSF